MLKQKEVEIFRLEEKSKTLLQTAQRDAEECIAYFKGLAYSKQDGSVEKPQGLRTHRETEGFASGNVTFTPI